VGDCAIPGLPTLTANHLATARFSTLKTVHCPRAAIQTLAVDPLAKVGLLTLVVDHFASPGFPTLVVYLPAQVGLLALVAVHYATAGFPTLAAGCLEAVFLTLIAHYLATVRFLMVLENHCPPVAKNGVTRRPNLPASPAQVSRP
jgi:hypothetical protein